MRVSKYLFCLFFVSCTSFTKDEYIHWVESDLVRSEQLGKYNFRVGLRPPVYQLFKQKGIFVDSLLPNFKRQIDFILTIENTKGTEEPLRDGVSLPEYQTRVAYTLSELSKDFKLVISLDTIECSFVHYEPSYNLGPRNRILMSFESEWNAKEEMQLLYEDKIFRKGLMKFSWTESELKIALEPQIQK